MRSHKSNRIAILFEIVGDADWSLWSTQRNSDEEVQSLPYFEHNLISKEFCSNEEDRFNSLEENIYQHYPLAESNNNSDNFSAMRDFERPLQRDREFLCQYLPPPEEKWQALDARVTECGDQTITDECIMLRALHGRMKPERDRIAAEAREGIRLSTSGISDEELEVQVNTRLASLSAGDLMPSEGPRKILRAFIDSDETPSQELAVTTADSSTTPTTPNAAGSEARSGGGQAGQTNGRSPAGQRNTPGRQSGNKLARGDFGNSGTLAGQSNAGFAGQNTSAPNPTQEQIQRNMDNLYRDVANWIDQPVSQSSETDPMRRLEERLDRLSSALPNDRRAVAASGSNIAPTQESTSPLGSAFDTSLGETQNSVPPERDEANIARLAANGFDANGDPLRPEAASGTTGSGSVGAAQVSNFGSGGSAGSVPKLTISGDLDQSLDAAVNGSLEEAQQLYNLLTSDEPSIEIVDSVNSNYKVRLVKDGDGFKIVPLGNSNDRGFQLFLQLVTNSVNIREEFSGIINRLEQIPGIQIEGGSQLQPAIQNLDLDNI